MQPHADFRVATPQQEQSQPPHTTSTIDHVGGASFGKATPTITTPPLSRPPRATERRLSSPSPSSLHRTPSCPSPTPTAVRNILLQMEDYDFYDQERKFRSLERVRRREREEGRSTMCYSVDELPVLVDPTNNQTSYGMGTCGLGQKQSLQGDHQLHREARRRWTQKKIAYGAEQAEIQKEEEARAAVPVSHSSAFAMAGIRQAKYNLLTKIQKARTADETDLKVMRQHATKDLRIWTNVLAEEKKTRLKLRVERAEAKREHAVAVSQLNKQEYELHRAVASERRLFLQDIQKTLVNQQQAQNARIKKLVHAGRADVQDGKRQQASQKRRALSQMMTKAYEDLESSIAEQLSVNEEIRQRNLLAIHRTQSKYQDERFNAAEKIKKIRRKEEAKIDAKNRKDIKRATTAATAHRLLAKAQVDARRELQLQQLQPSSSPTTLSGSEKVHKKQRILRNGSPAPSSSSISMYQGEHRLFSSRPAVLTDSPAAEAHRQKTMERRKMGQQEKDGEERKVKAVDGGYPLIKRKSTLQGTSPSSTLLHSRGLSLGDVDLEQSSSMLHSTVSPPLKKSSIH